MKKLCLPLKILLFFAIVLGLTIVTFAVSFFFLSKQTYSFRSSIFVKLFLLLLVTAIVVWGLISAKNIKAKFLKTIFIAFIVYLWLYAFWLNEKVSIVLLYILFIISTLYYLVGYCLKLNILCYENGKLSELAMGLYFVLNFPLFSKFYYEKAGVILSFGQLFVVTLLVTLFISAIVIPIFFLLKKRFNDKKLEQQKEEQQKLIESTKTKNAIVAMKKQRSNQQIKQVEKNRKNIFTVLGSICCIFLMSWLISATSIYFGNFVFDFSKPEQEYYKIIETNSMGRRHHCYELVLKNGANKLTIPVSEKFFWEAEIGQAVTINHYDGLFFEYYLHGSLQ